MNEDDVDELYLSYTRILSNANQSFIYLLSEDYLSIVSL